ncbi:cyclin-dependent protein kinase [Rhodotorula toruloides]|uniref:Cyclin-dependent protein kinase n=1 Tax=Rhodotorula toruloides TaxID=5286 RepID=A0A511KIR3_RHOTO|nr:cyclin-dependent protein kinase [Rhodotorula toruloides]
MAGVPTGPRNAPLAGDVKRFFPGDEEEDEVAKNAPSGPAKGRKPPASTDKGKEGPTWEDRLGQRNGGEQERAQDDRGWVTRQGGDVPPPRRRAPSNEDDRMPPSQPMILNPSANGGPPQPAVLHRASYERPGSSAVRPTPAQNQSRTGGAAQAVPPLVAPRQWGVAPTAPAAHATLTPPTATPTGPGSHVSASATPAMSAPPSPKAMDRTNSRSLPPPTPSNPPTPAPTAPAINEPPPPPPTELYERLVQVGEGTYGKVYKARNVETGGLVALKRIRMEAEKDGFPVTAVREIKLLQTLRHPNAVELVEMLVSKGQVYMVLEYLDHDLTGVLHHPSINFSPAHLKSLMQQFLQGLGFIHRRGVLHRDLKGSNILLSKRGELKIADFGLARFYQRGRNNDYTNRVITQWYKPPELLFGATVYDERVDMWSAGCIFLELFVRRPIFPGQDEIHQLDVIFKLTGTPNLENWPGLQDLPWYELVKPKEIIEPRLRQEFAKYLSPAGLDVAEALLALDPARRPTADEALNLPYFVSEEPQAEMPTMLADVEGEWHEYESKRQRRRQRGDEGV